MHGNFLWVLIAAMVAGCVDSEVDPRSMIEAPEPYRSRVARHVNGSELWRAYFDATDPDPALASPSILFRVELERRVRRATDGAAHTDGDYDPGTIEIRFAVVHRKSGRTLYDRKETVSLPPFTHVSDSVATREEVQRAVFEQSEDRIFAYIDRWIEIAAIRAMGEDARSHAASFLPLLEEQVQDPWAEDLSSEAKRVLNAIREGS